MYMADPVAIVEKVVGMAVAIVDAVKTARENKEECRELAKIVVRLRAILSRTTDMVKDPMVGEALEDLGETLRRAHALVGACGKRNAVCRLCKAGTLSKRLRKVHEDISYKMLQAVWVSTISILFIPPKDLHHSSQLEQFGPPIVRPGGTTAMAWVSHERHSLEDSWDDLPSYNHDVDFRASQFISQFIKRHRRRLSGDCDGEEVPAAGSEAPSLPLLPGLTKFSLSELEAATMGFSEGNIIGRGGSSTTVFKGALHDGGPVAIKKFQNPPESLVARIYDELHLASELQREMMGNNNIIRILGYVQEVIQKDNRTHVFLVEEYMENGNMGSIIFGSRHDWHTRFRMIQGIAHGVHYLHEQHILHLDLKPSNVLLDSDMNPKITGLGRARNLNNKTVARDDSITGTVGYMPPEYILEGALSTKYDVYSFGVILLETMNGMCSGSEPARAQASVEWAWEAREGGGMGELLKASMCAGEGQVGEVRRCMEIGLLCVQEKPVDRPSMSDVLGMLNGEKAPVTPIRPKYVAKRRDRAARRAGPFSCFQGIGG